MSKVSGLFVVARHTAFTYKSKPVKVQQVGQELGVAFILEGSVRKVGERVRVTGQLVSSKDGGLPAGTVLVHGTAMDADGNGIPAGPITQRLVAGRQLFDFNARRTLRAGGAGTDGSFAYDADDPTGTHWTATYSGLTAADVDRALAADTRILWLGATPLAATEITIYENADAIANGPSLGCTAAEEPLDVTPPSSPVLTAAKSGTTDVQLTWTAAIDDFYVNSYAIYRDGVRIRNVGSKTLSFIDHVVPPGPHTYTVDAGQRPGPAVGQPLRAVESNQARHRRLRRAIGATQPGGYRHGHHCTADVVSVGRRRGRDRLRRVSRRRQNRGCHGE